jgi:hypothetical protein
MPKLTQAKLRGLIKKPGRHADGGGLYFRVIGEGKAYFVYRYRLGGKEHELSIGPLSEWSLTRRHMGSEPRFARGRQTSHIRRLKLQKRHCRIASAPL